MKKQTAVEWLMEQYIKDPYDCFIKKGLFQQAKEMEKEQMLKTYLSACDRLTPYGYYGDSAEQYYNETFNK